MRLAAVVISDFERHQIEQIQQELDEEFKKRTASMVTTASRKQLSSKEKTCPTGGPRHLRRDRRRHIDACLSEYAYVVANLMKRGAYCLVRIESTRCALAIATLVNSLRYPIST